MESEKGIKGLITKALYTPVSSVALMGLIAVLGISTGFVSYQGEDSASEGSVAMDTALPDMKGKGFKPNKYENGGIGPEDSSQDSVKLQEFASVDQANGVPKTLDETPSPDQGFGSNENLPMEKIATRVAPPAQPTFTNRDQVRTHYNQQLNQQLKTNNRAIEAIAAPAPLSAAELRDRHERDESMERAARMENMALSQMEMLQKGQEGSGGENGQEAGMSTLGATQSRDASLSAREIKSSQPVATVTLANLDDYVEIPSGKRPVNAFFGLKGERKQPEMVEAKAVPNAIEAVIHGDADNVTIVTGSTLKLRLLQDIQIGKYLVPRNSILTGECAIGGERVQVFITTVRIQSSIFPIKMRVYDIDGHPGIYVPNLAIKNQVSQTGAQAVTGGAGVQMPYMVPTGGNVGEMVVGQTAAQGVNMAINGVKTLTSKKMSLVKVTIRPNHRVYLKQDQN